MLEQILAALANPAVVSVVAMVLEVILHRIPSQKPIGILRSIVIPVLKKIAQACEAVAVFLDKVVPQKIKE